jgi:hypothetical protein
VGESRKAFGPTLELLGREVQLEIDHLEERALVAVESCAVAGCSSRR